MAYNFPDSPSNGNTVTINGIVYTYNSTKGAWKTTAASGGGTGGASVTVSETAPTSPSEGDLWFDPSVLKTFVYYNDGTANQWVQSNPTGSGGGASGGASVTVSETAPTSPSAGDLWWSSSEAVMYIYYTDTDSSQWVSTSVPGADGAAGADGADATGITKSTSDPAITTNGTLGDLWLNTTSGEMYALTDATANNNVWTNIGQGAGNIAPGLTASGGIESTYTLNNTNYKTHTFLSSGTLTVTSGGTVEYLVIAGGGGGGNDTGTGWGSGGGAGGYRSSVTGENSGGGASAETPLAVSSGTYNIIVGAGGASAADGGDSVFSTITSLGGGSGGDAGDNGGSGGSGGGGQAGGSGTTGQGYEGGSSGSTSGASGGGAGGVGVSGDAPISNFVTSSISNTAVNYANGGKGGTNNATTAGASGDANEGDGGEGGRTGYNGGSGGSGIVIIRYIT